MNHTILATVGVLAAIISALTGTIAISNIQSAAAQNANATDIENSETNFIFKQKLKNNCSGFANCTNTGIENFGGPVAVPTPGPIGPPG